MPGNPANPGGKPGVPGGGMPGGIPGIPPPAACKNKSKGDCESLKTIQKYGTFSGILIVTYLTDKIIFVYLVYLVSILQRLYIGHN
jgi:hypothetical protein